MTIHKLGIFDNLEPGVNFINCLAPYAKSFAPYAKILLHKKLLKNWPHGPNDRQRVWNNLFMKSIQGKQYSNIFTSGDLRWVCPPELFFVSLFLPIFASKNNDFLTKSTISILSMLYFSTSIWVLHTPNAGFWLANGLPSTRSLVKKHNIKGSYPISNLRLFAAM